MDERRRQYVPLYVYFAHGGTGTRLLKELGPTGLLAWVAYLAACKRNSPQGQLTYGSEAEGWQKLGLTSVRPDWLLADLWKTTGRMHLTRVQRGPGELTTSICRVWDAWEQNLRREDDAERKRRKRADNTPDRPRTKRGRKTAVVRTEGEGEAPPRERRASPNRSYEAASSDAPRPNGRAPTPASTDPPSDGITYDEFIAKVEAGELPLAADEEGEAA